MTFDLGAQNLMERVLYAIGISKERVKTIKYLPEILERIMDQEDAKILAKLGRKAYTTTEIAALLELSEEEAQVVIDDLFKKKGLIMPFPDLLSGSFKYRVTPMLLLHDMTLLNAFHSREKFGTDFLDLWDAFYKEEMVPEFDSLKEANLPPIFRVVPVHEEIIPQQEILPYETVSGIIDKAKLISVQPCVCRVRTHGKNCDYPVEVCMAFGPAAKIVIERGHGREVTKEEALQIKKKATDAGLVHLSSNASSGFIFICSCCECCCGALYPIVNHQKIHMAIPSRYQSTIDTEKCIGCQTCIEKCQFHAITISDENKAIVNPDLCWGCGVCVAICPEQAATLHLIHDKKQISRGDAIINLAKYGRQFGVQL